MNKTTAEAIGYVGADTTPTFDDELAGLPELDSDMPPRGKGPSNGYEERWREIARLHALGYTNNQIARHLGYSATGISLALQKPFVQAEIAVARGRHISEDAIAIMRDTSVHAARRLQTAVMNPDDRNGYDASKFVVEKVTGKARQEVTVESGTLSTFMELLKEMRSRGEPLDVIEQSADVGATEKLLPAQSNDAQQDNQWRDWLKTNI